MRRPLRSIRPMISPTRPRNTPSGLTRTRVRSVSLSGTVSQPTESAGPPEVQVVDPDEGEQHADDIHRPGDEAGRDHRRLGHGAGPQSVRPAQPYRGDNQYDDQREQVHEMP